MSASSLRLLSAVRVIVAAWQQRGAKDPATAAAQALEDAGLLMSPEKAAELERLRKRVADQADQHDDLAHALGRSIGAEWSDLISIAASGVQAEEDARTLRARVAELKAERHTTNEALSQAAEALRTDRDRIAELEAALRLRSTQRGDVAQLIEVAGRQGESCVDVGELASAIWLAEGEESFEGPPRHSYRVGRDLPETGGAR